MQSYELCCDMIDVVIDLSSIYGCVLPRFTRNCLLQKTNASQLSRSDGAVDSQSASVIKLNNSTILYLREVNKFLALVCILREDNFSRQSEFLPEKVYGCTGEVIFCWSEFVRHPMACRCSGCGAQKTPKFETAFYCMGKLG